jgi:hypothetical protein
MKKLTLTFATTFLAIACAANAKAESSTNSTTANQDASQTVRAEEKLQAPAEPLPYADFWRVKRQIDFSFQRLKSVSLPALQCHMSVDRVNRLFKRYAHENAEKYLANLKRNSNTTTVSTNTELAAHQGTSSWPDPYIIGR